MDIGIIKSILIYAVIIGVAWYLLRLLKTWVQYKLHLNKASNPLSIKCKFCSITIEEAKCLRRLENQQGYICSGCIEKLLNQIESGDQFMGIVLAKDIIFTSDSIPESLLLPQENINNWKEVPRE